MAALGGRPPSYGPSIYTGKNYMGEGPLKDRLENRKRRNQQTCRAARNAWEIAVSRERASPWATPARSLRGIAQQLVLGTVGRGGARGHNRE